MSTGHPSHALTEQKRPLRSALAITAAIRDEAGTEGGGDKRKGLEADAPKRRRRPQRNTRAAAFFQSDIGFKARRLQA